MGGRDTANQQPEDKYGPYPVGPHPLHLYHQRGLTTKSPRTFSHGAQKKAAMSQPTQEAGPQARGKHPYPDQPDLPAQALSQLSDLASQPDVEARLEALEGRAGTLPQQELSQPGVYAPGGPSSQPDQLNLPSQPDIPVPVLAPNPAEAGQPDPAAGFPPGPGGPQGVVAPGGQGSRTPGGQAMPQLAQQMVPVQEEADPGLHPKSKATRRGPMDEMRQLVRILVKIIPHSVGFIATSDEGGGGNRISEEQIKHYLDYTLGEAPRPAWGVPGGWGEYMSGLFTWATGKEITKDQAMRCAKREPGRSWEAIESELNKLGIFPATWPLPLSKEGLGQAAECPVPQPVPNAGSKRAGDDHKPAPSSKRRNVGGAADLDSLPEVELWQRALGCLQAVRRRLGTSPPEQQPQLSQLKSDVRLVVDELIGPYTGAFSGQPSAQTLSFAMPVIVQGPNGQLQQAYQLQTATMPPQMSGFPMGSMPPQTGSGVMQSAAPPTSMMSGGQPPTSYQAASGPSSSQYLLSQPGSQSAFQAVHPASQQPSQQGGLERTSSGHEVTKPQVFRPNASRPTPGGQVTSGSIPPRVGSAGPDGMRTNSPGAEMQHMVQQAIDRQQQMNPLPHLGPGGLEGPRPDVPASPSTEDDGERGPGSLQGTGTSKRQAPPAGGANKGLPFGMVYRPQAIKPDPKGQQRTSPGGDFNMDDEHPAPAPEAQGMPSAASAPFQSLLMDPAMMANPTYAPPGFMPPSVTSGAPMQHQQGMGHPAYAVPGQPGMVQPNGFGVAGSAAAQADGAAYVLPPQTDLQAPPQQPASSGWMPSVSAMLQ